MVTLITRRVSKLERTRDYHRLGWEATRGVQPPTGSDENQSCCRHTHPLCWSQVGEIFPVKAKGNSRHLFLSLKLTSNLSLNYQTASLYFLSCACPCSFSRRRMFPGKYNNYLNPLLEHIYYFIYVFVPTEHVIK